MAKRSVIFLVLIVFITLGLNAQTGLTGSASRSDIEAQGYSYMEAQGYNLGYKVVGQNLQVYMSAPTTGWLAVGFNPSRRMRDANIIIGYVKQDELTLRDDYGISDTSHASDISRRGTDNVNLLGGGESQGRTWFEFVIPLDSGDSLDQVLERGKTYPVIWAFGPNGRDDFRTVHGRKGAFRITLPEETEE